MESLSVKILFLVLICVLATSCATVEQSVSPDGVQEGIASWYGSDFHGKPTASGETYNMYAMTAAHKTLPLGTTVEVINLDNGRHINVVVNDRGPFVAGRIIDLSFTGAKGLNMVDSGTARVRLKVTGRDEKYVKYIRFEDSGPGNLYVIQLGAFVEKGNAERLKTALEWKYSGVYMARAEVSGRAFYRVRMGRSKERNSARTLAETLAQEGYTVVIMKE
ncbi:MAG: septal ring lytic transglycosylase RlpA family protein [Deltaproteobacteria bacterium]|nr:septal ring lytic transglycosylase RlpA family protein [Deltaproteobacteria bacterium]